MRSRGRLAALALVVAACSGGSSTTSRPLPGPPPSTVAPTTPATTSAPTTTVPAAQPLVDLLPGGPCAMEPVLADGEVTIVAGDTLVGFSHDGTIGRCLADGTTAVKTLSWGPVGDRVVAGETILLADGSRHPLAATGTDTMPVWTTPTGLRIVTIVDGHPTKTEVDGSSPELIGFLEQHDALVYHPAGTHYLTTGTQPNGEYGLWLARNDGQVWVLAAADTDARLSSPGWTADGQIVFAAHHSDRWDIHRIFLSDDGSTYEQLDLVSGPDWLGHVMASPFNPALVAYAAGGSDAAGCSSDRRARVVGIDVPEPLGSLASIPVGWLPDDRLVVAAFPSGCEGPIDVWVFTSGFCPGTEYGASFLVAGAEAVSARVAMPPPPPSPDDFSDLPDPAPA